MCEIWRQRHPGTREAAQPTRVLPSCTIDLVFNRADPFELLGDGGSEALPRTHLVGVLSRAIAVRARGRTDLLVVRLYPWAVPSLFGMPATELADRVVDLEALPAGRALGAVVGAEDLPGRLTREIALRLGGRPAPALAAAGLDLMSRHRGLLGVDRTAGELGVSRKHLHRVFEQQVGLGPKLASTVIRFQAAVGLARAGARGPGLALDAGYADQPHLIRSFTRFCGLTPTRVAAGRESALLRHFNGPRPRSHLFNTAYL